MPPSPPAQNDLEKMIDATAHRSLIRPEIMSADQAREFGAELAQRGQIADEYKDRVRVLLRLTEPDGGMRLHATKGASDEQITEDLAHAMIALQLFDDKEFALLSRGALREFGSQRALKIRGERHNPMWAYRDADPNIYIDEAVAKFIAFHGHRFLRARIDGNAQYIRAAAEALRSDEVQSIAARLALGEYRQDLIDQIRDDMEAIAEGGAAAFDKIRDRRNTLRPEYVGAWARELGATDAEARLIVGALNKGDTGAAQRAWDKFTGGAMSLLAVMLVLQAAQSDAATPPSDPRRPSPGNRPARAPRPSSSRDRDAYGRGGRAPGMLAP